jgi:ribosomal protein S18 acetylase RimI-like enzyme
LKVAETFLYPSREEATASQPAELLVIAVSAGQRSQGLGARLVQSLNHAFSARGISTYKVTVLQANQRANAFYQRLGFQLCGQFELYGKGWNVYQLGIR